MDGMTLVTNQFAPMDAVVGTAKVDQMQVAEFERLMQGTPTDKSTLDFYTPRVESPMDTLSTTFTRVGKQISTTFLERQADVLNGIGDVDRDDLFGVSDRMIHIQYGMIAASFQLQFSTSLVASANRGIEALFHMQG